MPLWGTTAASADNKPKFLVDDEDSDYNRENSYATDSGWVMRAGTAASGNDNADAQPEVLACIGELADTISGATITDARWIVGDTATTDMTAVEGTGVLELEITWDEAVTVTTTGGTPSIVVANNDASGAGQGNYTLTYVTTNSTANRKRFKKTSASLSNTDVLTVGGANIVLNSGTIKDTADGTTNSSLVMSGVAFSKSILS
jgi:hypothetical protein|tara:strand:- start:62 stop:670 length:609 start_codon:yes stop_codon:yes gene_type:complete